MYRAGITGQLKINGQNIFDNNSHHFEEQSVSQTIGLWEKVLEIQNLVQVTFKPRAQIELDEALLVEQLYRSLILKKPFKEQINIDVLTIKGAEIEDFNDLINSNGIAFSFQQDNLIEIFDAKMNLNSIVYYFDLKVKEVHLLSAHEKNYSLDIESLPGQKMYQSMQYFIGENQMDLLQKGIEVFQSAENIIVN